MKKSKRIGIVWLAVLFAVTATLIHAPKYLRKPEGEILKTAVTRTQLIGKKYILCKEVAITDADYRLRRNEYGMPSRKLCTVIGTDGEKFVPNLPFSGEFYHAFNTYVFYVEDKREYEDENDGEKMVEYVVTGWDLLWPIRHSDSPTFKSWWYVTEEDLCERN